MSSSKHARRVSDKRPARPTDEKPISYKLATVPTSDPVRTAAIAWARETLRPELAEAFAAAKVDAGDVETWVRLVADAAGDPTTHAKAASTIEPHVGPIVAPLVGETETFRSRDDVLAEAIVLRDFTAEGRCDQPDGSSLGTLLREALFDGQTDGPVAFLEDLDAEIDVVRMAVRTAADAFDEHSLDRVLDRLQRRARLTLELHERFKRAEAGRPTATLPPVSLPEPNTVVDALLALPDVLVEGASPLRTLDRMLRKLGCTVYREPPDALREISRREYVFRCYPRRILGVQDATGASVAYVPHDATNAERVEHFPEFVVQALAIREGFTHVPRAEWHRDVIAELRNRLGIVEQTPVASKGAA